MVDELPCPDPACEYGSTSLERDATWKCYRCRGEWTRAQLDEALTALDPAQQVWKSAREGATDLIRTGLNRGASPDSISSFGYAALHLAIGGGHLDCVALLIEAGADVDRQLSVDSSPRPLHAAAERSDPETVRMLLRAGADPKAHDAVRGTPLHWLGGGDGAVEVVDALLEAGADFDALNEDGDTPLMAAAYGGSVPAVVRLLDAGADLHRTTRWGETALRRAVVGGRADVVRELLARGARQVRSASDRLVNAVPERRPEIAEMLRAAQARTLSALGKSWETSEPLAFEVLEQIDRLGGGLVPPTEQPAVSSDLAAFPAISRFGHGVRWPKGTTFGNREGDRPWVWDVEFTSPTLVPSNRVRPPRPLATIGIADGGNYELIVALDGHEAEDPPVYALAHDELGDPFPSNAPHLSRFLATLAAQRPSTDERH